MKFDNYFSSFLLGVLLSIYIWMKGDTSNDWPLIFFSVILANLLIYSLAISSLSFNTYLSIIAFILFVSHPIINILGAYTKLPYGLSYEPLVLFAVLLAIKFYYNPIKLDKFKYTINNGLNFEWFNDISTTELIIYSLFLIIPMILYEFPKNIILISTTIISAFIALHNNNYDLNKSYISWNSVMLMYPLINLFMFNID